MADQAQRLREMAAAFRRDLLEVPGRCRVLAVTSGKGGVGKTNLSVNLAYALQETGATVTLLDTDLGLANADILVGALPQRHLGHFVQGACDLTDLVHVLPDGLRLVAGGSGLAELSRVDEVALAGLVQAFRHLEEGSDYLLLDTGAGLGPQVLRFLLAADEVLLVTTPEPTALADAYAVLKTLARQGTRSQVHLVVNQVARPGEGDVAARRLQVAAEHFLRLPCRLLGAVPWDPAVGLAVQRQRPFVLGAPHAPASRAVRELARSLAGNGSGVRPGRFFQRLKRLFA